MDLFRFQCTRCGPQVSAIMTADGRVLCPACGDQVVKQHRPLPAAPAAR